MDRVVTLPNFVTLLRFVCIPWFVWLVYGPEEYWGAAVLLAVLGSTDWVDGQIARRFNQVSTVGKVFDPTVDRIMLIVAAVVLVDVEAVPLWFGLAALARELVIMVLGAYIYLKGAARIDVQLVGKAGAMGLMICLPFFLASIADIGWTNVARSLAFVFGIAGLACSWYSLKAYRHLAIEAMKVGRKRRAESQSQDNLTR